ncbi:MAG: M23 family metallopeptidase [Bacillota bacterium]
MSTSDKKRCFTIMIVPHNEEATYSLRIPLFVVQIAVIMLVIGVAGLSILSYAYLRAAAEAKEAEELREINRAQQEEIDALAVETQRVMDQIHDIDELIDIVKEEIEVDSEELDLDLEEELDIELDSDNDASLENQSSSNPTRVNSQNSEVLSGNMGGYTLESSGYLSHHRSYKSSFSSNGVLDRAAENINLLKNLLPERSGMLDAVGGYVEEKRAMPSIWPARGRITSGFGTRSVPYGDGYQFHSGVDIAGSHGSSIRATADGEVVFSGYRGSLGNVLILCHGNDYETLYAHLEDFAVNKGDEMEKGEKIGYMGRSGRTTGTHLHYEVHHKGSPVNPKAYLNERY